MILDQDLSVPPDLKFSSLRAGIQSTENYTRWLSNRYQGSMSYLSKEERIIKINDTSLLAESSKSIIVFLLNYKRHTISREGYGKIASYASFKDYHKFFPDIIDEFMIKNELFLNSYKSYVDTGPILERSQARISSLGWVGKNSMLINQQLGSYTFIGVSISDLSLDSNFVPSPDLCGTCTRCIDSCPTSAINKDRTIDSNLCISYHTIENRGAIPKLVSDRMGDMLFGCDICNDVCPWNRQTKESSIPQVQDDVFSNKMKLEDIAFLDKESFDLNYKGSAIKRATFEGFARNALIALHNTGRDEIVKESSKQFSDLRKEQAALLLEKR